MSLSTELQQVLAHLIRQQHVAALGTTRMGAPEVTMVLYAAAPSMTEYYMHISGLAHHTQNIKHDARVSLMIMATPQEGTNPQQLPRVSIQGNARELPESSAGYEKARSLYVNRFPQSEMMFSLGDFGLYVIEPVTARFVAGFAQAHNLTREDFQAAAQYFSGTV